MVKILGLVDLVITVFLLAVVYHLVLPKTLVIAILVCLILKAIVFLDPVGIFDIGVGILLVLTFFTPLPKEILIVAAVFMGVKGFLSLFAT